MKKINIHFLYMLLATAVFSACQVEDPMASEQYQKEIYIVGAYNRVSPFELPYGDEQEAFVSISASGTKKVDQNVDITLKHDDDIIDWYNKKYMLDAPVKYRQLDPAYINIPSWTATLKSGELYTRFPFTINSASLHCDSLYAISFVVESTSHYGLKEGGTELIFTLKLTNDFSGIYQMSATKIAMEEDPDSGDWTEGSTMPVNIQRTLTASSANEVRFFHEKTKETLDEYRNSWDPGKDYFEAIKNFCVKFVRIGDSNKFTVESWDEMVIIEGEAEFKDGAFSFWYDYMENSNRYRMTGTFKE